MFPGSCTQNPCHNSGTCTVVAYGYVCKCPAGYTGDRCQKGIRILKIFSKLLLTDP